MNISLNYIALQAIKIIGYSERMILKIINPITINVYNVIHNIDEKTKIIFNSLLYKYFKICSVKTDGAHQLRFNPKMMETDILETNTRIYQRVFFTKGMIISYFDKELVEELCIDRYKNINAEMLFVNRINFSSIIKRFFFSCDVTAKELCSVLEQHTSNIVTIIDNSFEEMIFKDSMYLYF